MVNRQRFASFLTATVVLVVVSRCAIGVAQEKQPLQIRTVALMGEPAQGVEGAKFLAPPQGRDAFVYCRVNSAGRVCFSASIRGDGIPEKNTRDEFYVAAGVWAELGDSAKLVARWGDPAPGIEGMKIRRADLRWAGEDQVAVVVDGKGKPNKGREKSSVYFVDAGGAPEIAVVGGDETISVAGKIQTLDDFDNGDYTPDGKVTFMSPNFASKMKGIWSCNSQQAKVVAHTNQQCPGMEDGFLFRTMVNSIANSKGHVLFTAVCSKKIDRFHSVWWADPFGPAAPKMILQSGQPAPGIPDVRLKQFPFMAMNSNNQAVVYASLEGHDLNKEWFGNNTEALFQYDAGKWKLLLRRGDPAPDPQRENALVAMINNPVINDVGQVAMLGTAERKGKGGHDRYLWSNASGAFKTIAATAAPAPGTDELFTNVSSNAFAAPHQLVFHALHSKGTNAIWVSRYGGVPEILIKSGDTVEVRPGDKRVIKKISKRWSVTPAADGKTGYVAFIADFADKSQGILVATIK